MGTGPDASSDWSPAYRDVSWLFPLEYTYPHSQDASSLHCPKHWSGLSPTALYLNEKSSSCGREQRTDVRRRSLDIGAISHQRGPSEGTRTWGAYLEALLDAAGEAEAEADPDMPALVMLDVALLSRIRAVPSAQNAREGTYPEALAAAWKLVNVMLPLVGALILSPSAVL